MEALAAMISDLCDRCSSEPAGAKSDKKGARVASFGREAREFIGVFTLNVYVSSVEAVER